MVKEKHKGVSFARSCLYGLVGGIGAAILTYMEMTIVEDVPYKTMVVAYIMRVVQTYILTTGFIYIGMLLNSKLGREQLELRKTLSKEKVKKYVKIGGILGVVAGLLMLHTWMASFSWVTMSLHYIINKGIVEEIVYRYGIATFLLYFIQKAMVAGEDKERRVTILTIVLTTFFGAAFTIIPLLQIPTIGIRDIVGIMLPNVALGVMLTRLYIKEGIMAVLVTTVTMYIMMYLITIPIVGMLLVGR